MYKLQSNKNTTCKIVVLNYSNQIFASLFVFSSNISPHIPNCVIPINAVMQEDWHPQPSTFLTAASFLQECGSKNEQCVFKRFGFTDYKTSLFSTDKH